jgi:hypothetical protein
LSPYLSANSSISLLWVNSTLLSASASEGTVPAGLIWQAWVCSA